MTPEVRGVLETSLYVSDLERSRAFYTRLFSFPVLLQGDRFCALSVCEAKDLSVCNPRDPSVAFAALGAPSG